mgnify:CR=1 FL=1
MGRRGVVAFAEQGPGENERHGPLADSLHTVEQIGMGDAVVGLLSNQVDLIVTALPTGMNFVKTGKMNGLAISSAKRVTSLPEVPTAIELGLPFLQLITLNRKMPTLPGQR